MLTLRWAIVSKFAASNNKAFRRLALLHDRLRDFKDFCRSQSILRKGLLSSCRKLTKYTETKFDKSCPRTPRRSKVKKIGKACFFYVFLHAWCMYLLKGFVSEPPIRLLRQQARRGRALLALLSDSKTLFAPGAGQAHGFPIHYPLSKATQIGWWYSMYFPCSVAPNKTTRNSFSQSRIIGSFVFTEKRDSAVFSHRCSRR